MLNFIKNIFANFKITPFDSTLKARLKLVYLIPFLVAMFPIRLAVLTLVEVRDLFSEIKAGWTHAPASGMELLLSMLLSSLVRR